MYVSYRYRLLPRKSQHRALDRILDSQRELYNAALEERIGAYRKAGKRISWFDQDKGLTEWRRTDSEARALPRHLQVATLRRLDSAYQGYFRRLERGLKAGLPRFKGKGRFSGFGFSQFDGITLRKGCLRFKGMPGALRVHWHRPLPPSTFIRSCAFRRTVKGWTVSFDVTVQPKAIRAPLRTVGVDLGISTFAAFSDGGFIPSLRAARRAERRLRVAARCKDRKANGSRSRRKAQAKLARSLASGENICTRRARASFAITT